MAGVIATVTGSLGSNGGTTSAIDTTGANLIVVAVSCGNGVTVTFSDSKSNSWLSVAAASTSPYATLYYCFNPTVGSGHTFTAASTGGFNGICVAALHGTITSTTLDQSSTRQSSGTSIAGTSITPSFDNELVVTAFQNQTASGTYTVASPYDVLATKTQINGTAYGVALGCYTQSTAAATAPTWSQGANVQGSVVVASFQFLLDPPNARIYGEGIETLAVPTPSGRVYGEAIETLAVPTNPSARAYGLAIETLSLTAQGIVIQAPSIEGTAIFEAVPVEGSGSVEIQAPLITGYVLDGPVKLTQMGRSVLSANDADTIKVTQLGRTVVQEFGAPELRLTQMARQVLYRYTCDTPDDNPPPLLDTPIAHITNVRPLWQLLRMDVKRRGEDTAAAAKTNSYTTPPTWVDNGIRWMLGRFDIRRRDEEKE